MRIISKFHDYYDCIQKHGQDRSLIYMRNKNVVPYKLDWRTAGYLEWRQQESRWMFPTFRGTNYYGHVQFTEYVIGFCGKIYPLLVANIGRISQQGNRLDADVFCYKIEELDDFVNKNYKDKQIEGYLSDEYNRHWGHCQNRKFAKEFFDACVEQQNRFEHMFVDNAAPIFIAKKGNRWANDEYNITYNGELKPLQFIRIFDPYMAFQEISMYLGSTLVGAGKPMPVIPDDVMRDAKGFDKFSFRKDKKTKK